MNEQNLTFLEKIDAKVEQDFYEIFAQFDFFKKNRKRLVEGLMIGNPLCDFILFFTTHTCISSLISTGMMIFIKELESQKNPQVIKDIRIKTRLALATTALTDIGISITSLLYWKTVILPEHHLMYTALATFVLAVKMGVVSSSVLLHYLDTYRTKEEKKEEDRLALLRKSFR